MKNTTLFRRFLSVVLVLAMVGSLLVPAASAEKPKTSPTTEELTLTPIDPGTLESHKLGQTDANDESDTKAAYAPTDVVRVSIVLEKASTLDAGFDTKGIANNAAAKAYRQGLRADQTAMTAKIEKALSSKLDVVWNLTLAANNISANVRYDQIETIKAIDGVKDVFLENYYEAMQEEEDADQPMNGSASAMIGSNYVWANGYTGAGSKLAILDTGVDMAHLSFDGEALEYALKQNAEAKGMSYEAYAASLNLLTAEKIDAVKDQLNAKLTGTEAYYSIKVPFRYNYANKSYDAIHENDNAGHHGSHVAGISAANRFVKVGEDFKPALEEVLTQGVAPDAQIVNMDVFEATGGTWEASYMVAIEDAIILGCDSANLSLGSYANGYGYNHSGYEATLNKLVENGMVCAISMGNNGMWYDQSNNANMPYPYLYVDDVSFHTGGSPGTYNNSLAVASANNLGKTGSTLCFGESLNVFFNESASYGNEPIATLADKDLQYVFFENTGVDGEGNDLLAPYADAIQGKVVLCQRGASSFYQKVDAAWKAGAIACVIYNNDGAFIGMNLTGLDEDNHIPAVIITKPDGMAIMAQSEPVTAEDGTVSYYTGSMKVNNDPMVYVPDQITDSIEVSDFSSYGVPGTLTMKPEILAPGGNIYSVYGALPGETAHNQYVDMSGTSMSSPQINGMAGLLGQYIRENDLCAKTGLTQRQLINSLLMSTAHPVYDSYGNYWPVIRVGAGHANVADAINAQSYILMDESATLLPNSAKDGKVKAELGDDPQYTGEYEFSFTVYPMNNKKAFALHTDIFTQGVAGNAGYGLLQDTATMLIGANATYEINGTTYADVYHVEADVNMDGKTDVADAQAILDKVSGELAEDAKFDENVADVDGDGKISTYDAQMLLDSATSPEISVTEPTKVKVHIKLDEDWMAQLLGGYFTKGFYVQGYTYVQPVADEEGAMDVVHSIPILGYCGSWTDPSMLERTSVLEEAYGIGKEPYTGNYDANYMVLKDEEGTASIYMGNPYVVEEEFHPERLALQSNATIAYFNYLPIRNAYNAGYAVTDADGKVLAYDLGSGRMAPYYSQSSGKWADTNSTKFKVNAKLADAGVKNGDKVTVGFYALPEYVAIAEAKLEGKVSTTGALSKDGFKKALEAGLIGSGAGIMYDVTIDDTAPEITGASRDFITGNFTVKAKDDNYIAYVAVMNKNGTNAFAEAVPAQTEANQEVEVLLDTNGQKLPAEVILLVGDYAGNESAFRVDLSGEQEDLSGNFYAFTSAMAEPGKGNRMLRIDPETLSYNSTENSFNGLTVEATTRFAVEAAEYVEGYIFMACTDGNFYAMRTLEMDEPKLVGKYSDTTAAVCDMAYNVLDQQLYVLGENNVLYTMDITSGELTKVAEITITNPKNSASTTLKDLAIDGKGNFYSANSDVPSGYMNSISAAETFLYVFTLNMVEDGKIQNLAPVNNLSYGGMNVYNCAGAGSMAWDHNSDTLYMISNDRSASETAGQNAAVSTDNALYVVDVTNGKATKANETDANNSAVVYSECSGLIIIPASTGPIKPTEKPDAVSVDPSELTMLKGTKVQLTASVTPWTLTDKDVTWKSNDENVATVNAKGVVTAIDFGSTTITVTTKAQPSVSIDVPVSVVKAPDVDLHSVIWDEKGKGMASSFNTNEPNAWQGMKEVGNFYWGALVDDTFYGSTNDTFYAFDADTYEVTQLAPIDYVLNDACAMPEDLREIIDMLGGGDLPIIGTYGYFMVMYNAETYDDENGMFAIALAQKDEAGEYFGTFVDDNPVAIAFGGYSTDHANSLLGFEFPYCPVFYLMTTSGAVYKLYFSYDLLLGGFTVDSYEKLGDTGMDLTGSVGSMYYSEENNFLYVTRLSSDDDLAYIYAIDAENPSNNTMIGDFNETVWPVVGLYEFDAATDLVVRVYPGDLYLKVGDTADVNVRVKLGETNEYTAEIADPTVCSFEDGVVTALAAGETTITFTTVDVNKDGEHVSEQITVTVEDSAQTEPTDDSVYLSADFEANADGWTFVDADGDGKNWKWNDEYPYGVDYTNDIAVYPSGVNSLNWAISPAIDLTNAVAPELSLYVRAGYSDKVDIYAGTSDDTAAMTKIADEMTLSSTITQYSFDLSEYVNGLTDEQKATVRIAFLHSGGSDYGMVAVDNVEVKEAAEAEAPSAVKESIQKLLEQNRAALDAIRVETLSKSAKAAQGSTNAIRGVQVENPNRMVQDETKVEEGKVHVVLSEDKAVTNGLFTVNYDPTVLTLDAVNSELLYKSAHVDAENGVITFAYASSFGNDIQAGSELATLDFSYTDDKINTEITVTTTERNDNVNVEEEPVVIPVKKECYIAHFTDIAEYPHGTDEHSAIEWAFLNEVTAGTTPTTFEPNKTVNRAEAMVFLYAAKNRPDFEMPANKFRDVGKKHWAYKAVMWAVANNVTSGTSETTFSPTKTCARSEILTFFYAAEGKPEYTIENPYSDVKASHWYKDAAIWAYENGLERGTNGKFKAKTDCTRLTTVMYLYRYITGNARVDEAEQN